MYITSLQGVKWTQHSHRGCFWKYQRCLMGFIHYFSMFQNRITCKQKLELPLTEETIWLVQNPRSNDHITSSVCKLNHRETVNEAKGDFSQLVNHCTVHDIWIQQADSKWEAKGRMKVKGGHSSKEKKTQPPAKTQWLPTWRENDPSSNYVNIRKCWGKPKGVYQNKGHTCLVWFMQTNKNAF